MNAYILKFLKKTKYALMGSRVQFTAKVFYDIVIYLEVTIQYLVDFCMSNSFNEDDELLDELTIVVKTFERHKTVKRLLHSIRRYYPSINIIVVDDSLHPEKITGVHKIDMPYNSGISAGRNEALNFVKTKYTLFLDDDFVFFRKTKLLDILHLMKTDSRIDILGGNVIDLPFYLTHDYSKICLYPTESQPVLPIGSKILGMPVYDKVPNFFICRTKRIKQVGLDPLLKKLEHADFFTRSRGILVTVYNKKFLCLHAPTPFDGKYMRFRNNCSVERYLLEKKYFSKK